MLAQILLSWMQRPRHWHFHLSPKERHRGQWKKTCYRGKNEHKALGGESTVPEVTLFAELAIVSIGQLSCERLHLEQWRGESKLVRY